LKQELGVTVELVKGSGGIFLVEVDGVVVARKSASSGFPSEAQVVEAVRAARAA
jgi:predicted Rdx family selenoprotein